MEVLKTQMTYKKFLLDNVVCNRRFHVAFDDEDVPLDATQVKCEYCGITLLKKEGHPPLKILRDEIIIKTTKLSSHRSKNCRVRDFFPPKKVT